jgi:hypothetical protein
LRSTRSERDAFASFWLDRIVRDAMADDA